jgi:hypothetical protein
MVYHLIDTTFQRQIIFSLIAIILGLFGNAAKAEHGGQTWVQAKKSVVVVNPVWPGYDRPGLARQKERHRLVAVFISALMARKSRSLSSPLPML